MLLEKNPKPLNSLQKPQIQSFWLGQVSMSEALDLQEKIYQESSIDPSQKNFSSNIRILGCEHPLCLSVGRRLWKDFQKPQSVIDIPHYFVSRGGQMTFHNEGQLMIYPILNIKTRGLSIKSYLKILLQTTIECFEDQGLKCEINDCDHGIYVQSKKLVSIGLSYSKGWVRQGLAINISNDLSIFNKISVCGQSHRPMTSLAKENIQINLEDFFNLWLKKFIKHVSKQDKVGKSSY